MCARNLACGLLPWKAEEPVAVNRTDRDDLKAGFSHDDQSDVLTDLRLPQLTIELFLASEFPNRCPWRAA